MLARALVFDVFGTLVDWRTVISSALEESGVPGYPEELADHWRAQLWPATDEINKGARPWINFDELHFETLDEVLADRGVAFDKSSAYGSWRRGIGSSRGRTRAKGSRRYAASARSPRCPTATSRF